MEFHHIYSDAIISCVPRLSASVLSHACFDDDGDCLYDRWNTLLVGSLCLGLDVDSHIDVDLPGTLLFTMKARSQGAKKRVIRVKDAR